MKNCTLYIVDENVAWMQKDAATVKNSMEEPQKKLK